VSALEFRDILASPLFLYLGSVLETKTGDVTIKDVDFECVSFCPVLLGFFDRLHVVRGWLSMTQYAHNVSDLLQATLVHLAKAYGQFELI
jgi:hypothetical protein